MAKKKKRTLERERQNFYFMVYEMISVNRSIKKLHKLAGGLGCRISLRTLETYSSKYNWQSRLLERAAKGESIPILQAKDQIEDMKREHFEVFHDIGELVKAGIRNQKKKIALSEQAGLGDVLDVPLTYLSKMADYWQKGELLARGQATSKTEIIYEVMAPVVKEIMAVFLAVNVITNDPPELIKKRQVEFIKRGDAVLAPYYEETKLLNRGQG